MNKIAQSSALLFALLLGCAPAEPAVHPAVSRATLDLECEEDQLSQKNVDETTVEVRGCGKRVTYVEDCQRRFNAGASAALGMPATSKDCSWVPKSSASE